MKTPDGQMELPAFPWLNHEEWLGWYASAMGNIRVWQLEDGLVNTLVLRPQGIDFALDLSLEEISIDGEYETIMASLEFPPGTFEIEEFSPVSIGGVYPQWISRNSYQVILEGYLEEGSRYFLVDLQSLDIEEFCVNSYFPMTSPLETDDGRFIAWDRWNGVALETVIYDRLHSQVSVLDNFEFVGWASLSE